MDNKALHFVRRVCQGPQLAARVQQVSMALPAKCLL